MPKLRKSYFDLMDVAKSLLRGRVLTDAHLRRSVSTVYYAMFNQVACNASDLFLGRRPNELTRAKEHLRRSIGHQKLMQICAIVHANASRGRGLDFPAEICDFARILTQAYEQRIAADYAFDKDVSINDAKFLVEEAQRVMKQFEACDTKHKKSFLLWVLIENKKFK